MVILYLSNHFAHGITEAQTASPRHQLALRIGEKKDVIVNCPVGRHISNPIKDFLVNLFPKRQRDGRVTYLFSPAVRLGSIGTGVSLILSAIFLFIYLKLTRVKISSIYGATITASAVGSVLNKMFKVPIVVHYGDPDFAREKGLSLFVLKFLEKLTFIWSKPNGVVYNDSNIYQYINSKFGVKNAYFLPQGGYGVYSSSQKSESHQFVVPATVGGRRISAGRNTYGRTPSLELGDVDSRSTAPLTVLYMGQINYPYRVDLLVDAAPKILDKHKNVKFLVIGKGSDLSSLIRKVNKNGLSEHFIFTGMIKHSELDGYILRADITLNLAKDWCSGMKIVHYMLLKKPIISMGEWYNRYNEFLINGENCLLVPPDANKLADAILELIENSELRDRIAENGLKTIKPYTWDFHVETTLKLLGEVN